MIYRQVPNALTVTRLLLAGAFFLVLNQYRYGGPGHDPQTLILAVSAMLFVLGVVTDALDGHLARRWKVESTFGRIMDPFCDKVLVIGAFIYLAGPRFVIPQRAYEDVFFNMVSGVYPWMVALMLARELLVTGIRGELEGTGVKFPAILSGKLKMILQSVVVPAVLLIVWADPMVEGRAWLGWLRDGLVYATVLATVVSGLPYVSSAIAVLRKHEPPRQAD